MGVSKMVGLQGKIPLKYYTIRTYTIRRFSSIELACAMRYVPAGPVCVWFAGEWCTIKNTHTHTYTFEAPHFTLHAALFTPRFTLRTDASRSTHHVISSHLSSSHLISALLMLSHLFSCHLYKFFSTMFISFEHCSTVLISSKLFSIHFSSSVL